MLLAIFMWSQIFSLCGALESFNSLSLDDLDPEEIVTIDPFLTSINNQVKNELEALQNVIAAGLSVFLASMLCTFAECFWRQTLSAVDVVTGSNRLWLLQRRLLI